MEFENLALESGKWPPLREVVKASQPEGFVGEKLYRVSADQYLLLSRFNGPSLEKGDEGPYVSGVLLAPDESAARRAISFAIEEDRGLAFYCPSSCLPEGSGPGYGSILATLRERGVGYIETASYRVAVDGKFVHRAVGTRRFTYFFRSRKDDDSDLPYAVLCRL